MQTPSNYQPHQGLQEIARRHRQYPSGTSVPPSKSAKRVAAEVIEKIANIEPLPKKARRARSVSEQLRSLKLVPFHNRLANARDNRPRHVHRRDLASGWTLSKAARKSIRDKTDRIERIIARKAIAA